MAIDSTVTRGGPYGSNPSSYENANGTYTYSGNSDGSGTAVNAPSLAAAQQAWNAKYGGRAAVTPASTPQISQNLTPTYLSQLLGGTNPQSSTSTVGNIPQEQASTVDTSDMVQRVLAGLAPQFKQQNLGLTESLANAGIVGGSTGGAVTQQGLQQQAEAAGQIQPMILSALQGNQQATQGASRDNASNALNAGEYNAGAENANSQFDVSNQIKNAMFDASQGTQAGATLAGFQNQDWLAQLQAQSNLSGARAGGVAGAYQPVYQQPAQTNYGGLASAFAPTPTASSGTPFVTPNFGAAGQGGTLQTQPYRAQTF